MVSDKGEQTVFRLQNTSYNSLDFCLHILNDIGPFRPHISSLPITEAVRTVPFKSNATKF